MAHPQSVTETERPTRIGLLGAGIGGSRTPRMHLAAAEALNLPYSYDLIDATQRDLPEDPAAILDLLEAEGFDGLNVTYPFKKTVMAVLDDVSRTSFVDGWHERRRDNARQENEIGTPDSANAAVADDAEPLKYAQV